MRVLEVLLQAEEEEEEVWKRGLPCRGLGLGSAHGEGWREENAEKGEKAERGE